MKPINWAVTALALSTWCAATAAAQPMHWVKEERAGFTHYLPKDWRILSEKKKDPKKIHLGIYRYSSPNGRAKLFVRIAEMAPGKIEELLDKGLAGLKRFVKDLKPTSKPTTLAEPTIGFELASINLTGYLNETDPKTKKTKPVMHVIARSIQRFSKPKIDVTLTYLFDYALGEEMGTFMMSHSQGFSPPTTIETLRLSKQAAKVEGRQKPLEKAPAAVQLLEKPKVIPKSAVVKLTAEKSKAPSAKPGPKKKP